MSRITVRQAIEALARKRIVVRKQGKGTFVTQPAVRHDLRRPHGLFDSLFAQAANARTQLLRYELDVPPEEAAEAMRLRPGERAMALDRLYLIGLNACAFLLVGFLAGAGRIDLGPVLGLLRPIRC